MPPTRAWAVYAVDGGEGGFGVVTDKMCHMTMPAVTENEHVV